MQYGKGISTAAACKHIVVHAYLCIGITEPEYARENKFSIKGAPSDDAAIVAGLEQCLPDVGTIDSEALTSAHAGPGTEGSTVAPL